MDLKSEAKSGIGRMSGIRRELKKELNRNKGKRKKKRSWRWRWRWTKCGEFDGAD